MLYKSQKTKIHELQQIMNVILNLVYKLDNSILKLIYWAFLNYDKRDESCCQLLILTTHKLLNRFIINVAHVLRFTHKTVTFRYVSRRLPPQRQLTIYTFPLELKATVNCYFCNYGYNNKYDCNMSLSATMSPEPVDHVPSCPPTSRVTVALTIVFHFT